MEALDVYIRNYCGWPNVGLHEKDNFVLSNEKLAMQTKMTMILKSKSNY